MQARVSALPTPAFVVRRRVAAANSARMLRIAAERGVALRPHVKTHKCVPLARMQCGDAAARIVVSTLAEAEHFAAHGFRDVIYGIPVVGADKLARLRALLRAHAGMRVHVLVDHVAQLAALRREADADADADARSADAAPLEWSVYVKIDTGYQRAGVAWDAPEHELGALLRDVAGGPRTRLTGVYSHAGHSYRCCGAADITRAAVEDCARMNAVVERMRADPVLRERADLERLVVAVGATPICSHPPPPGALGAVNELHPGNYVLYDVQQWLCGACSLADCAAFVCARVLSHYPATNSLLIDAGALALSKDVAPSTCDGRAIAGVPAELAAGVASGAIDLGRGYGFVLGHPMLCVASISQEHGKITTRDGSALPFDRLPIGSLVRIVPNHACLAAANFAAYAVVDGERSAADVSVAEDDDDVVVEQWTPVRGW